ncbi:hypothetical protein D1J36_007805 [Riemerella anatipestifer]|uniref:hypothetical protein n=1 Tax=Riemerella anatipestifer TaxID=34085 RepID=UPI0012ADD7A9|nr:hypothetical protein [Riemerella anatipestifer]MDY3521466.1 hypothetical protein [Riemerella anatipestifer]MDY3533658.1 hypothetical protein [Riemerella anatipestifer]MDY3536063.1 hypothetical protein [Riemerella anatipestifer]USL95178.1 hypothetical protein D1J36_007805 [Riemerella anatipestifer]
MKTKTTKLSVCAFLGLGLMAYGQYDGKVGINESHPQATLEIKPNTANSLSTASTVEGVLIPRVSRLRAANMGSGVAESTLLYISSVADGTASGTTANVDATGFYFFKGGVWVKLGAGASSTTGGTTLQSITGGIRVVDQANSTEWAVPGTFCLVQTTTATINLPNPSGYTNKIIAVNNQAGTKLDYSGTNSPANNSTIDAGKGHILMSDGANWYVIGGSY